MRQTTPTRKDTESTSLPISRLTPRRRSMPPRAKRKAPPPVAEVRDADVEAFVAVTGADDARGTARLAKPALARFKTQQQRA